MKSNRMGDYTNMSIQLSPIKFLVVEDEPLMKIAQALTVVSLAIFILLNGIAINGRIFTILARRKKAAAIDKLLMSNTIFNLICHPLVLLYYIFSNLIFPMSTYIGTIGCLISVHFLDVFVRFHNFCFPASIALLRYLFVVKHDWVKKLGMKKVVNCIILITFIIPFLMTVFVQFPIFESIHFPYSRCMGRFETYFNPMHPDPITPGRRKGERYCVPTENWAFEITQTELERIFRLNVLFGCKVTTNIIWILMMGLPEILLYSLTFWQILSNTEHTALSGILKLDVIKKRRQKNTLNITMTCWTGLAQLLTNIFYLIILYIFFGKMRFYHSLLAVSAISLNFNILPLFYLAMADEDFKSAILKKHYVNAAKLFICW